MQCGDCKSRNVILDNALGEYYCSDCGLIIEDSLADFSDLSFAFAGDEKSGHHSVTSFMEAGKGLGTPLGDIIKRLKSLKGKYIESPSDNLERSFMEALPALQAVWNSTMLPTDLKIGSAMLYRKCIRKHLTSGRRAEEMALAVAYNVCITAGFRKDFTKTAKELGASMGNVYSYSELIKSRTRPISEKLYVEDYIRKGIAALKFSAMVSERATALGEEIVSRKLELGKHPAVVAGAAIYQASVENSEKTSKSEIAKALSVSERSISRFLDSL
jgi:transcription initiation factor TFIIB